MSVRSLITVRLPRAFALGRVSMAQAIGRASSGAVRGELYAFELHPRELIFARKILLGRTNIWLWRTNQKELAGDFALVDMSSPDPRRQHPASHATCASAGSKVPAAPRREYVAWPNCRQPLSACT